MKITYFPIQQEAGGYLFWSGFAVLASLLLREVAHTVAAKWRLQTRICEALPQTADASTLVAAAWAVKNAQEDRALFLLEHISPSLHSGAAVSDELAAGVKLPLATGEPRCWLRALASASWMARQKPGRALSTLHQPFPQLHALVFCPETDRVQLRPQALQRELAEVTSADLDDLAQQYIGLIDVLIASLNDKNLPFAEEAEDLLGFTTGRYYLLKSNERFSAWWKELRPVLVRGGGALLAGLRLFQREAYREAAVLLARLEDGGMLSAQAETLRRASKFMEMFTQTQWRMTSADIPCYFNEGCYYSAVEMGVLRYPTAELPEVVACCERGKVLRASKFRLIEDSLELWRTFGNQLAPQLSMLLKRLLEHKGRLCPGRLVYWQQYWDEKKKTFEKALGLLMDGIVAVEAERLGDAARLFDEVAEMEPGWSAPLVNRVFVHLMEGEEAEAREVVRKFQQDPRHGKDGQALIALGRMFATMLDDTAAAEKLFKKSEELIEPPTEPLICLGEVKLMEGHYMEAQAYFDSARQLDPALPDPKIGLARVYIETKRYSHAIQYLEDVVKDGPAEARYLAYYLLYRTYREMGHDRRAFEALDQVPVEFHMFKEPDILDDIAVHLESGKRYAKAREFAERAMLLRSGGEYLDDDPDALGAF